MKRFKSIIIILSVAMILLCAIIIFARDYPQWRGPDRDGISAEKGLLKQWPKEGPKLLWQATDIGNGYSTPAVVGKRLYIMANEGMEKEFVKAFDLKTGETVWATQLGKVGNPDQKPNFPGARSTPTVDGKYIYALSSDGDLACLMKKSGKIQWQKNLRTDFNGTPGNWAYSESPLIDGKAVICIPGGDKSTVIALNKKTGDTIWSCAIPECKTADYSSVTITETNGVKYYLVFIKEGLYGIDAITGKLAWSDKIEKAMSSIPTPISREALIYRSGSRNDGALVKLVPENGEVITTIVYKNADLPNAMGGTVLLGDYFYGTTSKKLLCIEFETGKVVWETENLAAGSLCYADGMMFYHGENGDVVLFEATPKAYIELGRVTPPNQPEPISKMEKSWEYPVVANGKLLIRNNSSLWCYAVK